MLACRKKLALLCCWACTAALRTPNPRTRPPAIARRGLFHTAAAAALAAVTTKPAAAATTVAAAKAALLDAIPATATGATRVVHVGSRRRKGSAPAKSRARGTGGANLPPELRGVDLDNLLDGIEY